MGRVGVDETISGEVEQRLEECHKSRGYAHLMTGTSRGGCHEQDHPGF